MTKQLILALSLAGTSMAVKAEPVVYYCNTQHFAQITEDGVANVKSYPFKMKVDSSRRTVEFRGEVLDGITLNEVDIWDDLVSFNGTTKDGTRTFIFSGEDLSYAGILLGPGVKWHPEGHRSKCDKF